MGFLEVLQLILIVLKLAGLVEWTWFQTFLPSIVACSFYATVCMIYILYVKAGRLV